MRTTSLLSLLPLAAAVPCSPKSRGNDTYDYIVVGGGTSGLVVAKRLSEDPNVSVLVVEAGGSVFNNENVTNPLGYGLAFGTDIDYQYQTVNQTYGGGTVQTLRAGKALGGTSTINGMAYTRAEASQIDAWEQIGNHGWNWDSLLPYYLKSEHFQVPDAPRATEGHISYDMEFHGRDGPLLTGWLYAETNGSFNNIINSTYKAIDIPWNPDVNSGSMVGFGVYPSHVDQEKNIREDAARAYYYPYQNQTNLKVLLNTQANKITWRGANGTEATADGVEVTTVEGKTRIVKAKKEVVLSAGSLASPLLLELSGIGNTDILSQYKIGTVVDLPTVGENLQDQMNNGLQFSIANNFTLSGKPSYVSYPSASQLFGNSTMAVAEQVLADLPSYAAKVASANGNIVKASDLLEFFKLQHDLIFKSQIPIAEVLLYMSGDVWDSEYWGLLPFSRGSIHIANAASTADAYINPNYFMLNWDLQGQAQTARYIRKLYSTAPFSSLVDEEIKPGLANVAASGDDQAWGAYLKKNYRSNFHPVGTAAMMPKEKGGVVDAELKVYGTTNVRVVDASVLPFQVCGHLVSTLYAVAEKASDLIKESSA